MPQIIWRVKNGGKTGPQVVGVNSARFQKGDAVAIDSNGWLDLASTSSRILGVALHDDVTMASTNQTVALVRPRYQYWDGLEMLFGADQACAQTDVGAYADLGTATTGAMQINLAAGTSGQWFVVDFNPHRDGVLSTTSDVIVEVAEMQTAAFAQA